MSKLSTWTTETLKTEIRKYESPEYIQSRIPAVSENWLQWELDCLCEELGKREEC